MSPARSLLPRRRQGVASSAMRPRTAISRSRARRGSARCADKNERAAIVAPAERLASMRDAMRRIANARLGHRRARHRRARRRGARRADRPRLGRALRVGPGGLVRSHARSRVARRRTRAFRSSSSTGSVARQHAAGRAVAMVGIPQEKAIQAFVGPPAQPRSKARRRVARPRRSRVRRARSVRARRARFASTARSSGRRHDVFDKIPLGESPLVLVGDGPRR